MREGLWHNLGALPGAMGIKKGYMQPTQAHSVNTGFTTTPQGPLPATHGRGGKESHTHKLIVGEANCGKRPGGAVATNLPHASQRKKTPGMPTTKHSYTKAASAT